MVAKDDFMLHLTLENRLLLYTKTPIKRSKMNIRRIQENVEKCTMCYLLVWEIGPANNCSRLRKRHLPDASHPSQLALK